MVTPLTIAPVTLSEDAPPRPRWLKPRQPEPGIRPEETQPRRDPKHWKQWGAPVSVSLVLHVIVLLILSLLIIHSPGTPWADSVLVGMFGREGSPADAIVIDTSEFAPVASDAEAGQAKRDLRPMETDEPVAMVIDGAGLSELLGTWEAGSEPAPDSKPTAKTAAGSRKVGAGTKSQNAAGFSNHFAGRTGAAKAALLKRMGGTPASEEAVARGLAWLQRHQRADGSWSFDHIHGPDCDCTEPGRLENCPNGATAMALLAFLGAGHTHEEGDYRSEVQLGLDFLRKHGARAPKGINFSADPQGQGNFYAHALATIALAEALAMTSDEELRPPTAGAVEFIAASQHSGGGWRYFPGQPGDTSVVAWQVMALKSAQSSRIAVPAKVLKSVDRFLGTVQSDASSRYGYMPGRRATPSMTAAGLLCRMYLGWGAESSPLKSGIRFLAELGPSPDDMYYNYYATQVLHHAGGPEWDRWNETMREDLVRSQIRGGHADGSWDVSDPHGFAGGRLYMTTLCILTLEVYYRHLPLYQRERIEFPLTGVPESELPSGGP